MFRVKLLNSWKRLLRHRIFSRLAYYTITITLVLFVVSLVYYRYYHPIWTNFTYIQKSKNRMTEKEINTTVNTKFILLWTDHTKIPFVYFKEGTSVFVHRKCEWTNCYVTGDRFILGEYSKFDIIVFNGPQLLINLNMNDLPQYRSVRQKYVFANIEAANNYRMCSKIWNGFFNWTWTYKLNSDAVWGYFIVKNATHHVIGPNLNIPWIKTENMDPVDDELKFKLKTKTQAAAWFVSNCYTVNRREEYVETIKKQLCFYNLTLDIYGECGSLQCPKNIMNRCLKHLQHNYYFYFAFENAFSEDYISEKVLHALNYNTVPVVLSGANYSRFLPPDSFLDALALGPEKLAKTMYDLIHNPTLYYKFFKWKKYYSFHLRHESPNTDDYCHFCSMANDANLMETISIYEDFDSWWNSSQECDHLFYDEK